MSKPIMPLALLLILSACSAQREPATTSIADSSALDFGTDTASPTSDAVGEASNDSADFD